MTSAERETRPPLWLATGVCLLVIVFYAVLRLHFFTDAMVPLTYALPLLLTLWHRDRRLHFTQVAIYCVMATLDVFAMESPVGHSLSDVVALMMMLINISTVAIVVDRLIRKRKWLIEANARLEDANAELEASNEELAAREEEISSQNEELQRQTEELEQQTEELQEQTEELQRQSDELQHLHDEAANRQRVLQSLLQITTSLGLEGDTLVSTQQICDAAVSALGRSVSAGLLVEYRDQEFQVRGHCGLDEEHCSTHWEEVGLDPFVELVIREGRTACIEDLSQTPEVAPPSGPQNQSFHAVLATPLRIRGEVCGALVLYCTEVHHWSEGDFRTVEWLGAQASLVLQAMRLQEELDRRGREAEENSLRKTRFLAAVSHDVRTPANAISLSAELLKMAGERPELVEELPQMVDMLRTNAKMLVELVSDVLDLSRFDSGKIDLDMTDFNLEEVIRAEVAQYQSLAQAGGLTLRGENQMPGPVWVRSDRMKLARVLGNLIGNALKFTEVGTVSVQCVQTPDEMIEIRVADTGVGISPEHLEHIFDEFYQIKNPERDRSKGTGLGLAICKRLVDALGWSLTVRSTVGQGSTFIIRLSEDVIISPPLDAPMALAPVMQPLDRVSALDGTRVLLVEDHEMTRQAVARLLSTHGAAVDQAEDGRAALRLLRHAPPDVILLDLMLPDMDGREVLRHLLDSRPTNLKCVLAVSGDVTENRMKEIDLLGADGLVAKPIQMDQLVDRILKQIARKPKQPTRK